MLVVPTSDLSPLAAVSKRRQWDPTQSGLVEKVIGDLVALYKSAQIPNELRPTTLIKLGGDFEALYGAAFKRTGRPGWSEQRFPNGFEDLVREINQILAPDGITVFNTKTEVCPYGKLKQSELLVIQTLQEIVEEGELTVDQALERLSDDFGLTLSAGQSVYFFSEKESKRQAALPDDYSLRRRELCARIKELKSELGVNLGITECYKGLVFEGFVAAILADIYSSENVERQKELPVAYKDLYGKPHCRVYLDFYIADEKQNLIIETKLKNSYENIVNSAVAQVFASEQLSQQKEKVTVIYRHPCPLMRMAVDSKISITQEIQLMNLDELLLTPRRLSELVSYTSIEDFLKKQKDGEFYLKLLPKLDTFLSRAEGDQLQQYEDCLNRIAGAKEGIKEALTSLFEMAETLEPINQNSASKLFGQIPRTSNGESFGSSVRIKRIIAQAEQQDNALLKELYFVLFKEEITALTPEHLARMEAVSNKDFNEAALELLSKKESAKLKRLTKNNNGQTEGQLVLDCYNKIFERAKKETLNGIKAFRAHSKAVGIKLLAELTDIITRHLNRDFNRLNWDGKAQREFSRKFGRKFDLTRLQKDTTELDAAVKKLDLEVFENVRRIHASNCREIAKSLQNAGVQILSGDAKIRVVSEQLDDLEKWHNARKSTIDKSRAIRTLQEVPKLYKKIPVSAELKAMVSHALEKHHSPLHKALITMNRAYFNLLNEYAKISPFDALVVNLDLANFLSGATDTKLMDFRLELFSELDRRVLRTYYAIENEQLLLGHLKSGEAFDVKAYLFKSFSSHLRTEITRSTGNRGVAPQDSLATLIGMLGGLEAGFADFKNERGDARVLRYSFSVFRAKCAAGAVDALEDIITELPDEFFEDSAIITGKTVKLAKYAPRIFEIYGEKLFGILRDKHILNANLIADFYSRKFSQAAVLEYFADDLVFEYLAKNNPPAKIVLLPYEEVATQIAELSKSSDKFFEELVLL